MPGKVARNESYEQLTDILSKQMPGQPMLKERVYPWEKEPKKYEAWIVQGMAK